MTSTDVYDLRSTLAIAPACKQAARLGESPCQPCRLMVLADTHARLSDLLRTLPHSGHPMQTVFEEGHILASVLAKASAHHVLLIGSHLTSTFCLPRLIERLRQLRYDGCITFCTCDLTPEICAPYKAVSVDRCLQPPSAHSSLSSAMGWLQGPGAPAGPGLSIFEVASGW